METYVLSGKENLGTIIAEISSVPKPTKHSNVSLSYARGAHPGLNDEEYILVWGFKKNT